MHNNPVFFSAISRYDADFIINAFGNTELIPSEPSNRRTLKASTTGGKTMLLQSPIAHIESQNDAAMSIFVNANVTKLLFKSLDNERTNEIEPLSISLFLYPNYGIFNLFD